MATKGQAFYILLGTWSLMLVTWYSVTSSANFGVFNSAAFNAMNAQAKASRCLSVGAILFSLLSVHSGVLVNNKLVNMVLSFLAMACMVCVMGIDTNQMVKAGLINSVLQTHTFWFGWIAVAFLLLQLALSLFSNKGDDYNYHM